MPEYNIEAGSILSSGRQTPFWLISNQYGIVSPEKFNGLLGISFRSTESENKRLDYDYELEITDRQTDRNKLYLNQAWLGFKIYFVKLEGGLKEETFGNQDSSLSSGGLLWSGNARPMPKISLKIPDFTPVPYTSGFFEFKGGISHGWFGDNQFVKNAWLHHKYLYIQLGGGLPVHIHYGLHHFAQWGGESKDPEIGRLPDSFRDYLRVFLARQGSENAVGFERSNTLGNHLGSHNLGLNTEFAGVRTGLYWQTIFEDSSGVVCRNIRDGLFGIYIRSIKENKLINGLVYEFLNTTDQSGIYCYYYLLNGIKYDDQVPGSQFVFEGGNDNYFNNEIYRNGWSYNDMVIGTPLVSSRVLLNEESASRGYLVNNKIVAHHIGLEGVVKRIRYSFMGTFYRNFGTNRSPYNPAIPQMSLLLRINMKDVLPRGLNFIISMGLDHGDLYGNNFGVRTTLSKRGLLK